MADPEITDPASTLLATALTPTPPPATDRGTVRLVVSVLSAIDLVLWVAVLLLINKAMGQADPDQRSFTLALLAPVFGAATGTLGTIGGMLINTRTPQA